MFLFKKIKSQEIEIKSNHHKHCYYLEHLASLNPGHKQKYLSEKIKKKDFVKKKI